MKILEPLSLYTNSLFVIPFFVALSRHNYFGAVLVGAMTICSVLFHAYKPIGPFWWFTAVGQTDFQTIVLWLDTVFANVVILYSFYRFYQAGFPLVFWFALLIAILAFIPFWWTAQFTDYQFWHALWHVAGAIVVTLALLV